MSDQPKPTTGEATAKSMAANKIRGMHEQMQQNLADARKTKEYANEKASEPKTGDDTPMSMRISPRKCRHDLAERETACADGLCPICLNAALALQQELHGDEMTNVQLQLQRQLAAEREIKSAEKQILLDEISKNQQLRSQLAANQLALRTIRDNPAHSYESPKVANDALNSDTTALDAAIAAAQKPLVDTINKLYELADEECITEAHQVREAALAKVKEGK